MQHQEWTLEPWICMHHQQWTLEPWIRMHHQQWTLEPWIRMHHQQWTLEPWIRMHHQQWTLEPWIRMHHQQWTLEPWIRMHHQQWTLEPWIRMHHQQWTLKQWNRMHHQQWTLKQWNRMHYQQCTLMQRQVHTSKRGEKKLTKETATCFWKNVIDEANDNKEIGFTEFIEQVKDNIIKRKNQGFTKKEDVNVVKILIDQLFENRGSTKEFSHILSLTAQTGNTEAVIKLFRSKLSVVGLGYNVVPCIRLIKKTTAEIQTYFVSLCHPERTFSGFRCDLIKCVELAAYLLGMYDLCGLRIDIWGDGCEIGGLETTRFAFRVLSQKISCQSSSSVFCFASYRGKDSRFAMEQNLGPTIAGDQSSGDQSVIGKN